MARVPEISVVIPCYNSAWSIGRTIESIRAQRFTEWEVIVVDDGSDDDLQEVLAPFLTADPRVRLIRQENRGLAGARNRGIEESRSGLVAPIDADDIWHPDFLAETFAALAADPAAPFAFTFSFRMLADDRVLPFIVPNTPPRHDLIGLLTLNSVGSGSAALYRKSAVIEAGLFDEQMGRRQLHGAEDWKLILRLARSGTPAFVERYLVGYRLVETSMSQKNPLRQLLAVRAVLTEMRAELPDVSAQVFRDGNTMMTAWLLPTFAFRREIKNFLCQAIVAYGGNPLWFRNPLLRRVHYYRAMLIVETLKRMARLDRRPFPTLRDLELDGEKPFAYMSEALKTTRSTDRPVQKSESFS